MLCVTWEEYLHRCRLYRDEILARQAHFDWWLRVVPRLPAGCVRPYRWPLA